MCSLGYFVECELNRVCFDFLVQYYYPARKEIHIQAYVESYPGRRESFIQDGNCPWAE